MLAWYHKTQDEAGLLKHKGYSSRAAEFLQNYNTSNNDSRAKRIPMKGEKRNSLSTMKVQNNYASVAQ